MATGLLAVSPCEAPLREMEHDHEGAPSPSSSSDLDAACWICLLTEQEASAPLIKPCRCPRHAHLKCLARWQLQSAGRSEESCCRFCHQELPDWKASLAVPSSAAPVPPIMAIKFDGRTYKLRVKPGADGLREFQAQVRQLLGFNITDDFDVTFECQIPHSGERMKLTGLSSYGAATHCAAITAAQRDVARAAHRERANLRASAGHLQASAAPAGASAPVGPSSSPADLPPYVRSDSGSRLNLRPLDGGASSSLPPLPPAFLSLPLPRPSTVPQASPRPNTSMPRPATMSPRPVISTPLAPLASPRSTAISPRARHVALAPSPAPPSSATTAALLLAAAAPQGVTVSAEVVCEEASMRGLFKGLVERTKVQLHKMLH